MGAYDEAPLEGLVDRDRQLEVVMKALGQFLEPLVGTGPVGVAQADGRSLGPGIGPDRRPIRSHGVAVDPENLPFGLPGESSVIGVIILIKKALHDLLGWGPAVDGDVPTGVGLDDPVPAAVVGGPVEIDGGPRHIGRHETRYMAPERGVDLGGPLVAIPQDLVFDQDADPLHLGRNDTAGVRKGDQKRKLHDFGPPAEPSRLGSATPMSSPFSERTI